MRVLQIVHGYPPSGRGGAELYAESVATRLQAGGDLVTVLTRESVAGAPEFSVRQESRDGLTLFWINNTFRTTRSFEDTYINERITARASRVIDAARPDVAHIHHLTCLSTTIVDALVRRGIPIVLTLHDYWLLCHRGQLLDRTLTRCDGPGDAGCARCTGVEGSAPAAFAGAGLLRLIDRALPSAVATRLRGSAHRAAAVLGGDDAGRASSLRRLRHMQERFALVSTALAPSSHVRDRFVRAGFVHAPIVVSEYGVAASPRPARARTVGSPLRLGFAGALMVSKAPHLLADAVASLPAGAVAVEIYGAPAPYHGDDAYLRDLGRSLAHPAITRHGPIAHADVPSVFASLDALVFPSVWEETSGIGAREALAAGVPVIASRIGGIPETVRHDVNGLLFEPGDAADLARQIRRLVDEPGLLDRLADGCDVPRRLEDDVDATHGLYQDLVRRSTRRRSTTAPADAIPSAAAVVLNYRTPEQTAVAVEMLRRSEARLTPLIVVDNGDGVDCGAALARFGGEVALRATGGNLGFSGGCNVGIRDALSAEAAAVLLVNSDVIVPPGCLTLLLEALERQSRPGIVAPVVRSRVWPDQVLSAGIDYDTGTGRMRHRLEPEPGDEAVSVSGCAMLVHRSVFDRIGLLPEEYFFSFEDIAFCQRARAEGFDVALEPRAAVYHEGSGTMGTSPRRLYFAARNHLRLGAQTPARSSWHRSRRQCAIAAYNLAHAVTARGGALPTRLAAVTRGIADHLRGRYGEG
jgi:GT2 family glycosyltransferase/glycosyltransferase involved in cell wall biosynthesis